MERRFLLALVLAGAVMFLWNVVFFPPPPPKPPAESAAEPGAAAVEKQEDALGVDPFAVDKADTPPQMLPSLDSPAPPPAVQEEAAIAEGETDPTEPVVQAELAPPPPEVKPEEPREEFVTLETPDFAAVFTSRGARITSFVLKNKKYSHIPKGSDERVQLDIVSVQKPEHYPFALLLDGANFQYSPLQHFTVTEKTDTSVRFETTTPQGMVVSKHFVLDRHYLFRLSVRIENKARGTASFEPKIGMAGLQDEAEQKAGFFGSAPLNQQIPKAFLQDDGVWEETDRAKLYDEVIKRGNILWAGIDDRYFLMALLPSQEARSQIAVKIVSTPYTTRTGDTLKRHLMTVIHSLPKQEVAPGESLTLDYNVYMGPKDYTSLAESGPQLEEAIDFWILGFLGKPMLWVMKYAYGVIPNWGIAIIILTIIIKILLYPLTRKSYLSMAKMKDLKPKIDKLKEQTGDDKAAFNQKMMELYKKEGVNPLGGCLPILLQLPVYIALYRMLMNSVELYNAPFIPGWLNDLVMPDPYYVLPVLLAGMMYVQQKMTPTPDSQQQKMMLYMMPAMMFFFMLWLPSGLVLYILANTMVSIGQTWWIQKRYAPSGAKRVKA